MEYKDLVSEIAATVLLENNTPVRVGNDVYHFSSLDGPEARKKVAGILAAQNKAIDNLSVEDRANREAQFKKAQEKRAVEFSKEAEAEKKKAS